ncbi:hypothetical protein [Nitrosomonas oligotropha]|uniref:hypothetical protein n=1 Tax=Nitrosomonas oligotropha TaxID=42354 RepID=UPI00136EF7EC|nr:hypothetical protein [Nitrosomonas oligotropha]MXS82366.1 hypothetical protein [Nitrosomonas oligotropha]
MPSEEVINWQQIHRSGAHPDTLTEVFQQYLYRTKNYTSIEDTPLLFNTNDRRINNLGLYRLISYQAIID